MKQGINPVTIRGTNGRGEPYGLTLMRAHIQDGDKPVKKSMTATIQKDKPIKPDQAEILPVLIFDEEVFLSGMEHLFPAGEFNVYEYRDVLRGLVGVAQMVLDKDRRTTYNPVAVGDWVERAQKLLGG